MDTNVEVAIPIGTLSEVPKTLTLAIAYDQLNQKVSMGDKISFSSIDV